MARLLRTPLAGQDPSSTVSVHTSPAVPVTLHALVWLRPLILASGNRRGIGVPSQLQRREKHTGKARSSAAAADYAF